MFCNATNLKMAFDAGSFAERKDTKMT